MDRSGRGWRGRTPILSATNTVTISWRCTEPSTFCWYRHAAIRSDWSCSRPRRAELRPSRCAERLPQISYRSTDLASSSTISTRAYSDSFTSWRDRTGSSTCALAQGRWPPIMTFQQGRRSWSTRGSMRATSRRTHTRALLSERPSDHPRCFDRSGDQFCRALDSAERGDQLKGIGHFRAGRRTELRGGAELQERLVLLRQLPVARA